MIRPLVLLLSSLWVTGAAAQATGFTATLSLSQVSRFVVGPQDCSAAVQVNWNTGVQPCDNELNLWLTTGSCGETRGTSDFPIDDPKTITSTTGTSQIVIGELPGTGDGGVLCGSASNVTYKLCGAINTASLSGCSQKVKLSSPPTLVYDGVAPDAPTITEILPMDNALTVKVAAATGTSDIRLEYKLDTETDFRPALTYPASNPSAKISGLTNNLVYNVRAYGRDEARNESAPSAVAAGSPVNSEGFYGRYTRAGGAEDGGCSAAGGVAILPAALVALWSLIRRRRS